MNASTISEFLRGSKGFGYDLEMPSQSLGAFAKGVIHDPRTQFSLDVSGMRAGKADWERLDGRFGAVFDAMEALEKGAIANPDEGRQVGHYWLRDASLAPTPEIRSEISSTHDRILRFASAVHSGEIRPKNAPRFAQVILVGIGGSALGPLLVTAALAQTHSPLVLHVADNTDPDGIDTLLGRVAAHPSGLAGTLVLVISKSGGTKETRNGMLEVKAAVEAAGLEFASVAVAVTGVGSELDRIALRDHWLERFPMWDWVGGRTSVTSSVGLLPLALLGVNTREFLEGAAAMDSATRTRDSKANLAARLASAWFIATKGVGAKDMVLLPYKDRLELIGRYLQQLIMESIGKELDLAGRPVHQGLTVYGNKGSTDQHAYVQQLRDGVDNFFVLFIEVLKDRVGPSIDVESGMTSGDYLSAFFQGTRRALHERKRRTMTLTIPEISPSAVGALIALFERATGYYASLIGINAYHQPGVEAGKKAATSVLALQKSLIDVLLRKRGKAMNVRQLARAVATDDIETVFMTLRHSAGNSRFGVELVGMPRPDEARFLIPKPSRK